jgi:ApaG protein
MYTETTQDIRVEVSPQFVPQESDPRQNQFFFSYHVKITNLGGQKTQLLSRHWIITDGNGEVHEVEGPGVVGQQPHLAPGESFEYSSFCPLATPTGNMRGKYWMVHPDSGEKYAVKIPLFFLRDTRSLH